MNEARDDRRTAELGPRLLASLTATTPTTRLGLVIAVREYESWLIAGAIHGDLDGANPENLADAKGWLKARLGAYSPTVDQPRLTARIDVDRAASLRSFRKLLKEVHRVTGADVERGT